MYLCSKEGYQLAWHGPRNCTIDWKMGYYGYLGWVSMPSSVLTTPLKIIGLHKGQLPKWKQGIFSRGMGYHVVKINRHLQKQLLIFYNSTSDIKYFNQTELVNIQHNCCIFCHLYALFILLHIRLNSFFIHGWISHLRINKKETLTL